MPYDFDKIVYNKPRINKGKRYIGEVIGLDSETRKNGKPFIFALSDGNTFTVKQVPDIFFTREYESKHYGVYNMKFDSGSLLYNLPPAARAELRELGETTYNGYKYSYIPHKFMRISTGKKAVTFWDIAQYFHMSLEKAASKYLGKHKDSLNADKFTDSYIKKNLARIKKYCIQDARLVAELYDYFLAGLLEVGIKPAALYSTASIAQTYFKNKGKCFDIWRFWKRYNDAVRYAYEAYNGGKFEVYKRGRFDGVMYDINSAYPYEMANLWDIRNSIVKYSCRYEPEADYGFLRVVIYNPKGKMLPSPFMYKILCIYPAGSYKTTITKQEYDYIRSQKVRVKILSGWWFFLPVKKRYFAGIVTDLYNKKQECKGKDDRLYMLYKILLNSFYGKMIQRIETIEGDLKAGLVFNPMYAAIITANVRIKITKLAQEYVNNVLAVHTDSIIMDKYIDNSHINNNLGGWDKQKEGNGLIIACGIYQLGSHVAMRGFKLCSGFDLIDTLSAKKAAVLPLKMVSQPKSWVLCNHRGRDAETNVFSEEPKDLNLNCETKRLWLEKTDSYKLLKGLQDSVPRFITPY